ncbi:MAG: hypothetical protein JRJ42_09990, partial [Deltaproteobacteria bacterium]|nr:hypothetical protein [Deltaproteobacteria bacterium]
LSLTLQNFNPADPLDPALKDVKPFTEEAFSRMQEEVDRIMETYNRENSLLPQNYTDES